MFFKENMMLALENGLKIKSQKLALVNQQVLARLRKEDFMPMFQLLELTVDI